MKGVLLISTLNTERFKFVENCRMETDGYWDVVIAIYYDTLTKVMYQIVGENTSISPLLDSDGKPMLYQEGL